MGIGVLMLTGIVGLRTEVWFFTKQTTISFWESILHLVHG